MWHFLKNQMGMSLILTEFGEFGMACNIHHSWERLSHATSLLYGAVLCGVVALAAFAGTPAAAVDLSAPADHAAAPEPAVVKPAQPAAAATNASTPEKAKDPAGAPAAAKLRRANNLDPEVEKILREWEASMADVKRL